VTAEEKSLQKIRLQQAEETLADCRGMLKIGGSGRSIINRAYYAAYYAILALLVAAEETPRRHNHAISLFDRLYVKTGKLSKATSIQIHQLFPSGGGLQVAQACNGSRRGQFCSHSVRVRCSRHKVPRNRRHHLILLLVEFFAFSRGSSM
jgi:uncharacterized protein (UPF0332 family)